MDPNIWGPKMWFSLHSITFTYPFRPDSEQKERFKNFFKSLEYILPCKICRVHYSKNIRKHPIENNLKDRKSLVYWLIDIHNMVNQVNNKRKYSYDEVMKIYEDIYNKEIVLNGKDNIELLNREINEKKNIDKKFKNKKKIKLFIYNNLFFIIIFLIALLLIIIIIVSFLKKKNN